MAFRLVATTDECEFRALRSGVSQATGKPWMSIVVEGQDADQVDIRVPAELQGPVMGLGLRKGDMVTCRVRAISGPEYGYVSLVEPPAVTVDAGAPGETVGY